MQQIWKNLLIRSIQSQNLGISLEKWQVNLEKPHPISRWLSFWITYVRKKEMKLYRVPIQQRSKTARWIETAAWTTSIVVSLPAARAQKFS